MHVGAPLVAHQQAAEAVQPGEAALYHPALAAQAGAVRRAAAGDLRLDAPLAELSAVPLGVVAAVGEQARGPPKRSTDAAAQRRHGVEQQQQFP